MEEVANGMNQTYDAVRGVGLAGVALVAVPVSAGLVPAAIFIALTGAAILTGMN